MWDVSVWRPLPTVCAPLSIPNISQRLGNNETHGPREAAVPGCGMVWARGCLLPEPRIFPPPYCCSELEVERGSKRERLG